MAQIELRQDDWFEAGKDAKDDWPIAHEIYKDKQELYQKLMGLNIRNLDRQLLEEEIQRIEAPRNFRKTPYIVGNRIYIPTCGPPGEAYLGKIVEQ